MLTSCVPDPPRRQRPAGRVRPVSIPVTDRSKPTPAAVLISADGHDANCRVGWGNFSIVTRGVQKVRGPTKKETNFTTKRGVRDVTLLKRPLTQSLANRSSCRFTQAVGCCKNVCYFCKTQRRSAGSSDSIRSVTEKCRKGYP